MFELFIAVLAGLVLIVTLALRYIIAGTLWITRRAARYLNERKVRRDV